jgi:hypothetical protein
MEPSDRDQLARDQTIDILSRKGSGGGFGPSELKSLKDAVIEHLQRGGDLNYGLSLVNPSMNTFAPSIRLTLSLELPKEATDE